MTTVMAKSRAFNLVAVEYYDEANISLGCEQLATISKLF